jgi:putative ABC transport system permease protein
METLLQDLRYAFRTLVRQPAFTAVALLTLAIGIGANTAIYTVVDATMLRPLPYGDPSRLMKLSLIAPAMFGRPSNDDMVWSYPKYQFFRQQQNVFEDAALYQNATFTLTGAGDPEQLKGEVVSASYFPVLKLDAALGRTFRPDEDTVPERDLVAVISHGLWQTHFGGDPEIAGKTIGLDQQRFTIVGVLPAGVQGLSGPSEVWIPVHGWHDEDLSGAQSHSWCAVARLKPGVSPAQATVTVAALGPRIEQAFPRRNAPGWGAKATTLEAARLDPSIRRSVLVLFGAVGCVLLIACVNVANLLLARGSARQREIAVRLAIGANRGRLVRQLLTESLLLAVLGAAASVLLAWWGVHLLGAINPTAGNPFGRLSGLTVLGLSGIRLDWRALAFTFAVSLPAGLLFGLAPALQGSRGSLTGALSSGGRSAASAAGRRSALVILEVALSVILLTGAGLMLKSFARLIATRSGVDPENVLTLRISVPYDAHDAARRAAVTTFFHELEQRVAATPGVLSAGLGNCFALAGGCNGTTVAFPDRPSVTLDVAPSTGVHFVSSGYFRAMKIPLLRGRWFTGADRAGAPKVIVIGETAARRFWPGEDPIGKRATLGQGGFSDGAEVVGIVGDVRYGSPDEPARPDMYEPFLQATPQFRMMLFVRTAGNPLSVLPAVRREVLALNRNLPTYDVKTMDDRIHDATARARFTALLLALFAAIALALAAIGLYGVMSYLVTQRTREIGIRVALGAGAADVLAMVLRRGALLALAGIVIGLAGALAATRILRTMLYEVTPQDPATYLEIAGLLAAVALAASYIPARRASAVDAATALRAE